MGRNSGVGVVSAEMGPGDPVERIQRGMAETTGAPEMTVFNELDHRLSVVKRWAILHTIQTQSVAEHVHNVVRIAKRIATEWFDVDDPAELLDIIEYAHHHDDFESLMGDPPSMIKPYIDETAFEREHQSLIKSYKPAAHDQCKQIVKLADMLEGYHFLCIENSLGNKYAAEHLNHEPKRIRNYVISVWQPSADSMLLENVNATMAAMFNEHSTRFSMRGR